jgi:quercetin dioxygenase-like cupin family protein
VSEEVIVRRAADGKTMLVGESDYVTYTIRSAETHGAYFCFEIAATPAFGPPLHRHPYRELFYVLDGSYEFTFARDGHLERTAENAGAAISVLPDVTHSFRNTGETIGRLLIVHQPAALEPFFDEFDVAVARPCDLPEGFEPPDYATMAAALERNGVSVVAEPAA